MHPFLGEELAFYDSVGNLLAMGFQRAHQPGGHFLHLHGQVVQLALLKPQQVVQHPDHGQYCRNDAAQKNLLAVLLPESLNILHGFHVIKRYRIKRPN